MKHPRDENLRLIGAEEEAAHIRDRFLTARDMLLFFGFVALVSLASVAFIAPWREEVAGYWSIAGLVATTSAAISIVFAVLHAVKMAKYAFYRRSHERFLRKHNRM